MLHGYFNKSGLLQRMHDGEINLSDAIWIDLISPDLEEEKRVEEQVNGAVYQRRKTKGEMRFPPSPTMKTGQLL
ncbi:MAG: hypothetical protein U5K75_11565 [Ahrensia sp.]|nr:hypothetical protein [Ahrensia sp.]